MYVFQSAISYSLKELEIELGYSLFYRNSKGIEPTVEDRELYMYISPAFNIIKSGEDHIKNLNSMNIGDIKIGASSHIAVFYFSSFISEFRKLYPGIKFEIISKSTSDLVIDTLPINTTNKVAKKIGIKYIYNRY